MNDLLSKVPYKYVNLWYKDEHKYRIMTITNGLVEVNETTAYIWLLINGENTIKDIIDKLSSLYPNVSLGNIQNDVCKVINSFVEMETITVNWAQF